MVKFKTNHVSFSKVTCDMTKFLETCYERHGLINNLFYPYKF